MFLESTHAKYLRGSQLVKANPKDTKEGPFTQNPAQFSLLLAAVP